MDTHFLEANKGWWGNQVNGLLPRLLWGRIIFICCLFTLPCFPKLMLCSLAPSKVVLTYVDPVGKYSLVRAIKEGFRVSRDYRWGTHTVVSVSFTHTTITCTASYNCLWGYKQIYRICWKMLIYFGLYWHFGSVYSKEIWERNVNSIYYFHTLQVIKYLIYINYSFKQLCKKWYSYSVLQSPTQGKRIPHLLKHLIKCWLD